MTEKETPEERISPDQENEKALTSWLEKITEQEGRTGTEYHRAFALGWRHNFDRLAPQLSELRGERDKWYSESRRSEAENKSLREESDRLKELLCQTETVELKTACILKSQTIAIANARIAELEGVLKAIVRHEPDFTSFVPLNRFTEKLLIDIEIAKTALSHGGVL
jgi:hypothetical protein